MAVKEIFKDYVKDDNIMHNVRFIKSSRFTTSDDYSSIEGPIERGKNSHISNHVINLLVLIKV